MQLLFEYSTEQPHISKVKKKLSQNLNLNGLGKGGVWGERRK